MKQTPDCIEGPDAWMRFDALVSKVMAVPIQQRESEYKKRSAAN